MCSSDAILFFRVDEMCSSDAIFLSRSRINVFFGRNICVAQVTEMCSSRNKNITCEENISSNWKIKILHPKNKSHLLGK
jgi:hypothetical protein